MVLLRSKIGLKPGDSAPDFSLKNVDGNIVSLSDFKGKIITIIFMCNHCPYVKPKMGEIGEIQNKYKDVAVVCINSNDPTNYPEDDFEHMKQVAEENGYKYYLVDEAQDVARVYGAVCTPDIFVFDKDHKLIYHGRINNAMNPEGTPTKHDLQEVLDYAISNKKVEEWFRSSQGCSIKWRE